MKTKTTLAFLAALALILAGVGAAHSAKAPTNPAPSPTSFSSETPAPSATAPATPTQPPASSATAVPEVSAEFLEMDIKRGSFLTDDIRRQTSAQVHTQVVNGVAVSVSRVVRLETRAFLQICMKSETTAEPLDFGALSLDYPGGQARNSIVHTDVDPIDQARCLLFEFVSIPPSASSAGWQFTMEWVGFTLPDEGAECAAYLRRAQANAALAESGIQFTCETLPGSAMPKITAKPAHLTDAQAEELLHQAVAGITHGPWVFAMEVE